MAPRLADVIRARHEEILRRWEARVRALPHAHALDRPQLIDHVPELLERIARMTDEIAQGRTPSDPRTASEKHALSRLDEGYDLLEVITEFRVLRDVVFQMFYAPDVQTLRLDEARTLNAAIDTAITDSVERYSDVRERTLQAFDRIAVAAAESNNLDELLGRLLHALHDTTPAIDTSAIYLREGDVLRLRAAVGLGHDAEVGLKIRIGEGVTGTIAARGEPLTLHHPTAAQVRSPALARANLRILHGEPIFGGDGVIGVAKIGSLTAEDFSIQDQRIFAAMIARASTAILQRALHDEARRAAERLAESERQLRALADNIPQLAWMADPSGSIYWFNQRFYDFTGTTFEAMRGWGWASLQHPDHLARVLDRFRGTVASGERWEDTFPLRGKDGRYRWFLSRAVPIRGPDGAIERWFGTNTDITEQRFLDEASRLLGRSLDYRATLEQLAQLTIPYLADWCLVDLVENGELQHVAIAHTDPRKLELARAYMRAHPPELKDGGPTAAVLRTGEPQLVANASDATIDRISHDPEHAEILRAVGSRSWIGTPLVARGETFGVIHLVRSDATRPYGKAELEVAAELGRRAGFAVDNARLYRATEQAVRMRENVMAIVSHDLRNPLGAIELGATLLRSRLDPEPRAARHVETIQRAAGRMEHLIDDLLDMANINAGRFAIEPKPLDTGVVLDEALEAQEPAAGERGIAIRREGDVRGVPLHADRDRLLQAFGNLLGNALKFCTSGDTIVVRAVRDGDRVLVAISDTGPGIATADLPHIFEPYWSGRARTSRGAGLGLFITRAIVEAHGGQVEVETAEGKGTTFTVTLPVRWQA